jgi:CRP-like cAMP-binding protein
MQRILTTNYPFQRRNGTLVRLSISTRSFIKKNELFATFQPKTTIRFFSSSDHQYIKDDWHNESYFSKLRRNAILLRGKMTEQRSLSLPIPKPIAKLYHSLDHKFKPLSPPATGLFFDESLERAPPVGFSYQLYKFLNFFKINYPIIEDDHTHIKTLILPYTLSNLAGHGSFLCLALAYMESDYLHLRMYAFTGVGLAMVFQYYREKPLWIPIRWNGLFLLINLFMIMTLMKEESDASNLTEEEKHLFKTLFEKRGMRPVDYLHLISLAKRLEFHKTDKLVDEKKKNNRVYLVKKGKLSVYKNGQQVGHISTNQFVGAMSFLSWEGALETSEAILAKQQRDHQISLGASVKEIGPITSLLLDMGGVSEEEEIISSAVVSASGDTPESGGPPNIAHLIDKKLHIHSSSVPVASPSVVVEEDRTMPPETPSPEYIAVTEDGKEKEQQQKAREFPLINMTVAVWKSTLSYIPFLNEEESIAENNHKIEEGTEEIISPVSSNTNDSVLPHHHQNNSNEASVEGTAANNPNKASSDATDGQLGAADVICEEDCIVYSWRFKDLHQLIMRNPKLGLVFERCLSEDLNKKMTSSWEEEIKSRYKQILLGAIMDGEVNAVERKVLSKFRDEYHISADDHERILGEFDWNLDDYDRGYRG